MRVFLVNTPEGIQCLNIDNDVDAAALAADGARELTTAEIEAAFGGQAHMAGGPGTVVEGDDLATATVTWTPDLAALAATVRAAVQAAKVAARDGGFEVSGVLFDSDLSARVAYAELAGKLAADADYSTTWKASEGVWVTMDAALYAQAAAAGEAHIAAVFAWQAARDAEIDAAVDAGDAEALAAVSTTYGEAD